jgi:hypothetical protein
VCELTQSLFDFDSDCIHRMCFIGSSFFSIRALEFSAFYIKPSSPLHISQHIFKIMCHVYGRNMSPMSDI